VIDKSGLRRIAERCVRFDRNLSALSNINTYPELAFIWGLLRMPLKQHSKVLVIGGTGFIGFHIVQSLLANNMVVTVFTRDPENAQTIFSHLPDADRIHFLKGDINHCSEAELVGVLQAFDKLVFAAGVDERADTQGEAWTFFKQTNVDSCEKLFRAAQQSRITHAVLLSSIFLQVARAYPELELAEKHPYIRSRVEQNDISQALAKNHFILTTLEVPWVFGVTPHLPSQWRSLITYARSGTPLLSCRGGVNVIAVESIGEAVAGALQFTSESSCQTIGDLNLSHAQLMQTLCEFADRRDKKITLVSDTVFQEIMRAGGIFKNIFNIQSGLDIRYMPELLMQDIYVDNLESKLLLGYSTGKAMEAIRETVLATPEHGVVKGWRKMLNMFYQ
jgi:dihydroflavonol-4-reductase